MALRPRQRPGFLRKGHFRQRRTCCLPAIAKLRLTRTAPSFPYLGEDGRSAEITSIFDGSNPTRELGYLTTLLAAVNEKGLSNLTLRISSGKEEGLYVWEDKQSTVQQPPASYEGLPADTGSWPEENNRILNKLGADVQIDRPAAFHEETALSQLKVKKHLCTRRGGGSSVLLVVQNLSDYLLRLNVSFSAYDANGNELAAQEAAAPAFESRSERVFIFNCDKLPASFDYTFSASEETEYAGVTQDLTWQLGSSGDQTTILVSNTGPWPAEYLVADILFYQGDTVVDYIPHLIFTGDDMQLSVGQTLQREVTSEKDYDFLIAYFSGYAYGFPLYLDAGAKEQTA